MSGNIADKNKLKFDGISRIKAVAPAVYCRLMSTLFHFTSFFFLYIDIFFETKVR